MSPRQIGLSGLNREKVYRANPEFKFDYHKYAQKNYKHDNLYSLCFDDLQPKAKQPLEAFVSDEDDLGPEVIMNLKWLDAYRYPQNTVYLLQDLVQTLIERYDWARILSNPSEDGLE